MWAADLLVVTAVIVVVVLAMVGVVWTDNRLHEDRSGDEGGWRSEQRGPSSVTDHPPP